MRPFAGSTPASASFGRFERSCKWSITAAAIGAGYCCAAPSTLRCWFCTADSRLAIYGLHWEEETDERSRGSAHRLAPAGGDGPRGGRGDVSVSAARVGRGIRYFAFAIRSSPAVRKALRSDRPDLDGVRGIDVAVRAGLCPRCRCHRPLAGCNDRRLLDFPLVAAA